MARSQAELAAELGDRRVFGAFVSNRDLASAEMDEVARVDACDDGAAIDEGGQNGEAIAFAADFDANSRTFSASRSRQFPGFDLEHDAFFEIGDDFGHESREIVVGIESAARQVREFATREAVLRHGMQGVARPDHAVSKGAVDSAILFDEESNPAGCIDDACVHAEWLGFDPDRLAVLQSRT